MKEKNQYAVIDNGDTTQKTIVDYNYGNGKWDTLLSQKSSLGTVIVDSTHSIVETHGAINKLFGTPKNNDLVLGRSLFDLFIESERERITFFMQQIDFEKWTILSYIQLNRMGSKPNWVSLYAKKSKTKAKNRYIVVFSNTRDLEISPITKDDRDIYNCIFKMYEDILEKTGAKLRNEIAQDLFGIRVSLQHFILKHGHEESISSIKKTLRDVIYNLSNVTNDLNPTVLSNTGFLAAVDELILRFKRCGIAMKYKIDPKINAESSGFQLSCFRVIQDIFHKNFIQQSSSPMYLQLSIKNKILSLFLDGFLDPKLNRVETYAAYSDLFLAISNRIVMYSGSVDIEQRNGSNQLIIKMYI